MAFCLTKDLADKMKAAVRSGKLHPDKLAKMTSKEARSFFEELLGDKEMAKQVNLAYEKKLLLKNQERAMYDWLKDVTGLSKEAKAVTAAKIKATYADKTRRLWEPKEGEKVLDEIIEDVYAKKYKTEFTPEESQMITDLAADVLEFDKYKNKDGTWGEGTRADEKKYGVEWGARKVALENYTNHLVGEAKARRRISVFKEKGFEAKAEAQISNLAWYAERIAVNTRAAMTTVDNSFWGRQVRKLMSDPRYMKKWGEYFVQSYKDQYKVLKSGVKAGQHIEDMAMAEVYASQNYQLGLYENKGGKHKLALFQSEEDVIPAVWDRIPGIKRLKKMSDVAFSSGALRTRKAVADIQYDLARAAGEDLTDTRVLDRINKFANMMTGRGTLGKIEGMSKSLNLIAFAPKWVASQVQYLAGGFNIFKLFRKSTRRLQLEHTKSLLGVIASTVILNEVVKTLTDGETEYDPRSSLFAKVKIGTRVIDLTGGLAGYVTLGARIWSNETKSTETGIISTLGEDYGSRDAMKVFWDFTEGKLSPIAGAIKDMVRRTDFDGQATTLESLAVNLITPLSPKEQIEMAMKPEGAFDLALIILNGIGFSANVWEKRRTKGEKLDEQFMLMDPSQANIELEELKSENPALYKQTVQAGKDRLAGITPVDKAMKQMGIEDGERANYIAAQVEKLKTAEEKNAWIDELKKKGVINMEGSGKDVMKQLEKIDKAGGLQAYLRTQAAKTKNIEGFSELVIAYAKLLFIDQGGFYTGLFTADELQKIEGDTAIFKREVLTSEAVREFKRQAGYDPDVDDIELEHIIDRQLGGSIMDPKNYQFTSRAYNVEKTKVSNYLRGFLWAKKITKQQAETAIKGYVDGSFTFEQIKAQYN